MSDPISELLAKVPEKTGSAAIESLDPDTRAILDEFETWLVAEDGKAESTASAYKSYVAQAMGLLSEGKDWKELTTDVRSGVKAFVRYTETLQRPVEDEADEADES